MASRGAKPKPAHLRVIDGTHRNTRHGDAGKVREETEKASSVFGKPKLPTSLKGTARKAWDRYIAPAGWLDAAREPAAIAFCNLWAEFEDSPRAFPASRHGQLRAYMSELGLTDERNRGKKDDDDEGDEFFD